MKDGMDKPHYLTSGGYYSTARAQERGEAARTSRREQNHAFEQHDRMSAKNWVTMVGSWFLVWGVMALVAWYFLK